jgi:hypothetical protein
MKVNLTIGIPVWLDKICTWPLMMYRLWKYGYAYRRIYLGEEEWTILDAEDYYRLGNFKWHLHDGKRGKYYAVRSFKNTSGRINIASLHREIMKPPPGLLVDHKNLNPLDNRRSNLRPATHSQNMQNRGKLRLKLNTSSQFIGVCLDKRSGRWLAQIRYQGKRIGLGRFDSEIDAARAYDAAAKKYHGEFARLNFPDLTTGSTK